jgi:hypothetical protein
MDDKDYSDKKAYRRGVVLGFTVAEIILLILFALLLALAAVLIKGQGAIEKAHATNQRFGGAIAALDRQDKPSFIKNIDAALMEQIDYEKKVKELEKKMMKQSLPDDVYAELQAQKLDLTTKDGKEKFLDMLITALYAQKEAQRNSNLPKENIEAACRAGAEMQKVLGKDKNPGDILNSIKDSKAQAEHWKDQAAKCGLAGVLPPCYRESSDEPIPYIYDARIKPEGIQLIETVPEKYKTRLYSDFKNLPPTNKTLSESDFRSLTFQFLDWGRKNECRFYVRVYDDLANDKDRFKALLKAVENNFYKLQTW